MSVLVLDEVERLPECGQRCIAAGNDDSIPEHRRRRFHRDLDVDRRSRLRRDAAEAKADEARHRALRGERRVGNAKRLGVDAGGDEHGDLATAHVAVTGTGMQRQRR